MNSIASPVLPGETIADKYRVERFLGQGGMGVVVAARHLELEQTVAIKFLCGNPPPNARERFVREARAAALVKSEHVCRVYDVGKLESGEPYIVMEYLEGTDLSEKIAKEGRQPIADAVGWIIQACDALSSAHANNIVHRDLKPANLFLQSSSDGSPSIKVVDFGISKLPTSGHLTESIVVMGSPLYMSPEQLASTRDADARSDLWSLGVVLYELLTGKPPFSGTSLVQLAVAVREVQPASPRSLRGDIPAEVERAMMKCMAKAPEDRYATVYDLVEDLRPFAHEDVAALAAKLARRGRRLSDPDIDALSKTVQRDASSLPAPPASAKSANEGIEGKTLNAVQTVARSDQRRARWAFLAGIATVAVVAGIVRLSMPRRAAEPPAALVVSTPTLPSPATSSAPIPDPASLALTDATPTPTPTTTTTAATSSSAPGAIVQASVRTPARKPNPNPTAAPRPTTTADPGTVSSTATTPSVPPGNTAGTKKRELDRDYKNE